MWFNEAEDLDKATFEWINLHFHDELKRPFIYTGGRQPNYANDKTIDGEAFEVSEPKQIEDKR